MTSVISRSSRCESRSCTAIHMTVFINSETTPEEFHNERARHPEYQINDRGHLGFTALAIAARENNIRLMNHILKTGGNASINIPNIMGYTPLHDAVSDNNYFIVKILIEHKADVHAYSLPWSFDKRLSIPGGTTPLYIAAMSVQSIALTKLLLLYGAIPKGQYFAQGLTVLKKARDEIVQERMHLLSALLYTIKLPIELGKIIVLYLHDESFKRSDSLCCIL